MVYLTATLLPRDEEEFCQLMHIHREELKMIRGHITRKNVQYQVQEVEVAAKDKRDKSRESSIGFKPEINEAVLQLVKQKLEEYPRPAKIIIYSSIINGAEGLAEVLGCELYYRDIDLRNEKVRRLEDWTSAKENGSLGQGRVIVATNALGLGVDVPDIRVVIHVGKIWKLKDYA